MYCLNDWIRCISNQRIIFILLTLRSSPYFPVFGLNTEIYGVNLRIQSEYRKMRTRNNSVFEHFYNSEFFHRLSVEFLVRSIHSYFSSIPAWIRDLNVFQISTLGCYIGGKPLNRTQPVLCCKIVCFFEKQSSNPRNFSFKIFWKYWALSSWLEHEELFWTSR